MSDTADELRDMMMNSFIKGATLDWSHYQLPKWARKALQKATELDSVQDDTSTFDKGDGSSQSSGSIDSGRESGRSTPVNILAFSLSDRPAPFFHTKPTVVREGDRESESEVSCQPQVNI